MENKEDIPEDLDLVVATKDEAFWINVKTDTEKQIEAVEKQLKFLKAVLEMSISKENENSGD